MSDDKTQAVCVTRFGETYTYYTNPPKRVNEPWVDRWSDSQDMFKAAQDNPALDDLLKKAEMIYVLTK